MMRPFPSSVSRRACLAGLAGGALAGARLAAQTRRPNIVLVLADDLGWADLGCYGADLHETPHLDRLARDGMRFTEAYSASPVCTPTRASIMTGKHPARLGMTIWHEAAETPPRDRKLTPPVAAGNLPLAEVTLAEHLHAAGYLTALVGKWHLGTAGFYPETQGFDINIGGTFWGAPATFFHPYKGARRFGGEYRYVPGLPGGRPGEYLTDRLTDEALKVIDLAGAQPFFLYLAHHAPHTPIEAKPKLVEKYRDKLRPGLHHTNPTYAAMVESLDESVGRVRRRLAERGLARHTVFVFLSDNGGYLQASDGQIITSNYPLRSGKGSLYEGGVRVPLLVDWPGVTRPGAVSAEPVVSTDLFATLLDAAGVAGERPPDGVSLAGLLRDPKATLPRDALYFHYPHYYPTTTPVSAMRAREWKLLEYHEDGRTELYHLASDPGERTDLAAREPARAAALRRRLDDWRKLTGASMPVPNPAAAP